MNKVKLKGFSFHSKEDGLFSGNVVVNDDHSWSVKTKILTLSENGRQSWCEEALRLEYTEHNRFKKIMRDVATSLSNSQKIHLLVLKIEYDIFFDKKADAFESLIFEATGKDLNKMFSHRQIQAEIGNIPLSIDTVDKLEEMFQKTNLHFIEKLSSLKV